MNPATIPSYGLRTELDLPYAAAVDRVMEALKEEGFGVLTEIDVKATLKKKIDADFRRYVILGACNPHLAHRALRAELDLGLLLPCNVIVYERDGGGASVAIIDPMTMVKMAENPELEVVAEEADERLRRVIATLEDG